MVSLGAFAHGLNTLEVSLLEDFLRGEGNQKSSKAVAAMISPVSDRTCFHGLPSWIACAEPISDTTTAGIFDSLQVASSPQQVELYRTVNSALPRWQGQTFAVMSGISWATT